MFFQNIGLFAPQGLRARDKRKILVPGCPVKLVKASHVAAVFSVVPNNPEPFKAKEAVKERCQSVESVLFVDNADFVACALAKAFGKLSVGKGRDRGHKHGKIRIHDTRVDSGPGVEGKDKIKVPQNLASCGYAFPDLVAKILVPASGIEAILKKDDPSPGVFGKPLPQGCRAVVHGFGNRACLDEPEFFKPLCKALQNELMVCVGACLPAEEPQGPLLSHGPAGMLRLHEGGSCPKKREKSQDGNTKSNHALSSPQQCVSWPSSPCSRQRMVISSA